MSLRYTGEATMDEPALRDVERWKDKIEVRLDNRQVFFLFFGSAMVACMLFVLGVIVGKRLESRGRAEAPRSEDPLAALDRFGAMAAPVPAPAPLTFPRALIGGGPTRNRPSSPERQERADRADNVERAERVASERAERVSPERATAKATLTAASAPQPALPSPVASGSSLKSLASAPLVASPPRATPATSARKLAALPRPLLQATGTSTGTSTGTATVTATGTGMSTGQSRTTVALTRTTAGPASPSKEPTQPSKVPAAAGAKVAGGGALPAGGTDKTRGRFLLQLSSFPDRTEAEAFARRFAAQNAYVVASEIPGKGTWYRVRVGSYGTLQEASAAKTSFEHDHNVIAYVAGSGPAK